MATSRVRLFAALPDTPMITILPLDSLLEPRSFFLGFAINLQSDSILRNLGKAPSLSLVGGEFKYSIPFGGCFQLVSCANYLGEIVEWLGFAIACDNLAALSFFAFTCGNLIPRALSHHDWYRQKFEDYPPQRKAVIPFLL